MRLVLCGGATAGHIFPITATAAALGHRHPGLSVLAIGGRSDLDRRLFAAAGHKFVPTTAAPLVGAGRRLPWNVLRTAAATVTAFRAISRFRPHVALSGGGYASVPGSLACRLHGVPLVLQANDVRPGRAARLIARFARVITIACQPAASVFGSRPTAVTGLPLRPEFHQADAARARARFSVPGDHPLLVVMGGTQGASAINLAVFPMLDSILGRAHVVHLTGPTDIESAVVVQQSLPANLRDSYSPFEFFENGLADLLAAADLVISRAGGSIHEFTASGLPALLIPGLYAGAHQQANARWLDNAGAALVIEETEVTPETLLEAVTGLLDDPGRLGRMAAAASSLGRPDAAERVADILTELGSRKAA